MTWTIIGWREFALVHIKDCENNSRWLLLTYVLGYDLLKLVYFWELATLFEHFINDVYPILLIRKSPKTAPALNVNLKVLYNTFACLIDACYSYINFIHIKIRFRRKLSIRLLSLFGFRFQFFALLAYFKCMSDWLDAIYFLIYLKDTSKHM